MIEVKRIESFRLRNEEELLAAYADECSIATLGKPEPDWLAYLRLEATKAFVLFGVFSDSALVGFVSVLTAVLPHYSVPVATVESLFVLEKYRAGGAGTKLLKIAETWAKLNGCKAILYSAPAGGQLETLLGKRYARTNSVFCKPLG